ncbi:MAG TPA: hypothetical protein VMV16_07775 [Solirubrobacteraceae bacterium]|nr:hypothetical protein [Solirubrobacteraceae bacterium]
MLEDRHEVLAETQGTPEEIGAVAASVEWIELTEQHAVRPRARSAATGGVEAQHLVPWPCRDLDIIDMSGGATTQDRLERLALNRPVASSRDREDVAHDAIGRQATCSPMRARQQRLVGLALGHHGIRHRFGMRAR